MRMSDWSSDGCSSDLLAERAKPMRAQIPDGAFGDLMRQHLSERTGVGARRSAPGTHVPVQRARATHAGATPKRSLVRSAIALLLQKPALALELQPPYRFVALRQPGIELLTELIALVSARPDRSEEHTSELQSLMRISYAVFCLKKKNKHN